MNQELAWKALNRTTIKLVECPLVAMCFTTEQCTSVMAPALKEALKKTGAQRNTPRDLLCGPRPAQGMGLRNAKMTQFTEHVDQLLIHGMRTTLMGVMLGACAEGMELALGSSRLVWELEEEKWDKMIVKSWVKNTWKEA